MNRLNRKKKAVKQLMNTYARDDLFPKEAHGFSRVCVGVGVGGVFDVCGSVFEYRVSNVIKAIEVMTIIDRGRALF